MANSNVEQNSAIEKNKSDNYSILTTLEKIFDNIEKAIALYFTGILIVCLVVSMCIEVLLRFIFNDSLLGLPETVELAVVTITFTSLVLVQREDSNIKVDALISWLVGRKIGYVINFFTSLAIAALFAIIALVLVNYTITAIEVDHTTLNIFLPIWPVYVLVTLSSIIIVIRVLVQTKDHLMNIIKDQKGPKSQYAWSKSTLD